MKKSSIVLALGVGFLVGGPAYLYTNDANISVEFWSNSAKLLMNDPILFKNELPELFKGVVMTVTGGLLTTTGLVFRFLLISAKGGPGTIVKKITAPKSVKAKKNKSGGSQEAPVDIMDETSHEEKKSTVQIIKEKLSKKDEMSEFESEVDDEDVPGNGIFGRFKSGLKRDENKSGKKQHHAKGLSENDENSGEQEMWQRAISGSIVDGGQDDQSSGKKAKIKVTKVKPKSGSFMSGIMSKISANNAPKNDVVEDVPSRNSDTFDEDLKAWYLDVQRESKPKSELTQMAKIILGDSNEGMRENFVENNSIDGPFILRLLESWASRETFEDDSDDEGGYTDSKAALRAAVRAVKSGQKIEEADIPEDFSMDLSEIEGEQIAHDEPSIEEDIELTQGGSYVSEEGPDEKIEASNPGADEDDTVGKISDVISEMKWLFGVANLVREGSDEWPENLATEDYRMEEVKDIEDKFSRMVFLFDDEEIENLIDQGEDENFVWLGENRDILDVGFEDFIRPLIEEDDGDSDDVQDGDESSDGDADSNEEEGAVSDKDAKISDEENQEEAQNTRGEVEESQEEEGLKDVASESEGEISEGEEEKSDVAEKIEPEVSEEDVSEENSEQNADEAEGVGEDALAAALRKIEEEDSSQEEEGGTEEEEQKSEEDLSSDEGEDQVEDQDKSELEEPKEVVPVEDGDSVSSSEAEEEKAVSDEKEEEPSQPEEEVEEVYVPKNLTQGDIEELGFADSLILQWGISSKSAGAGGGAMGRLIYSQSQDGLKPLGFVHMAATWKERSDRNRLNVLFRYLEEGDWRFGEDDKYMVLNQRDDYIKINPEMFEHKETKGMVNVICFHGPGAQSLGDGLSEKIGGNVWVTNQIWDAQDIKASLDE